MAPALEPWVAAFGKQPSICDFGPGNFDAYQRALNIWLKKTKPLREHALRARIETFYDTKISILKRRGVPVGDGTMREWFS
jgi:hypothetical protein